MGITRTKPRTKAQAVAGLPYHAERALSARC